MVIQQNRYILAAQQLLRLWNASLGQRSGPVETARGELEAIANQAGVDLPLARRLTPESLELLVAPSDPLRCWLLAEMLYMWGRVAEREGDADGAWESDRRALHLFERVDASRLPEVELPRPADRIATILGGRDSR